MLRCIKLFLFPVLYYQQIELEHFQNRISKLNHWQHTMDNLRKQIDEYDHEKELMDEYAFAKAKVKDLTKFVSVK